MDSMLGENKNLKDTPKNSLKDINLPMPNPSFIGGQEKRKSLHYTKTNKLITALYMVTDTMEKEEPIRLKLRTLGVEILSDITMSKPAFDMEKIDQILSFLNIAFDIRMVSEMNCNILRKEFTELKQSILDVKNQNNSWLEKFVQNSPLEGWPEAGVDKFIPPPPKGYSSRGELNSKGHATRIGVQKGSDLMDALDKIGHAESFQILKNKRRESIIKVIKTYSSSVGDKPDGISIKDIMLSLRNLDEVWGEKTLQRELVSMVKDNVLKKSGEKRWSLYFIN